MTTRFYPCLLFYKGALRWEAQVLDFAIWGRGNTQDEAKNDATTKLQEHINEMDDQEQQLPHPTHQLVTEHKLVVSVAHGWALIGVEIEATSDMQDDIDSAKPPEKGKSDAKARNQRGKTKRRS